MSSVAVRWFVLETADRKAKTTCAKGNIRPKSYSQHLASVAKIFFSGPFQKQSFSLAMSQLEMVVYTRETWVSCSELERTIAARITISLLLSWFFFPKLLCFWTIWEVSAMLSLVPEPRVVSVYREHHNQKSDNWPTGWVKGVQNLCGKRNRNLIY